MSLLNVLCDLKIGGVKSLTYCTYNRDLRVPLKVENQIKVTNKSFSHIPLGTRNVIRFAICYNLSPGNAKNWIYTIN